MKYSQRTRPTIMLITRRWCGKMRAGLKLIFKIRQNIYILHYLNGGKMPITQKNIDRAIELAKEFGATKLLLFGSALTNPQKANDLDLGIEGIEPSKFFLFGGTLENIINKTVDIVPLEIDSEFVKYIKKYGKLIYEKDRIN